MDDTAIAQPETDATASPTAGAVVAALGGLAAGWLAAGSAGLLAHPLRHGLTWLALGVVAAAGWPGRERFWADLRVLAGGAILAVWMTASSLPPVNVLGVAVLLAAVAATRQGADRGVTSAASFAVAALAVWRLLVTSVPFIWLAADAIGGSLGRLAAAITGQPLWVGATFAGLDFLVAMAALAAAWLIATPPPRLPRVPYAVAAILGGHLVYLLALSGVTGLIEALPDAGSEEASWWATGLHTLLPWNLPILAGFIHLAIAGAMVRWTPWRVEPEAPPRDGPAWLRPALWIAPALLAMALPIATTLATGRATLEGKKVVVYEKGFLNWLRPKHDDYGRLAIGMYGLLPPYVESLGARCLVSPALSDADLADADVLILLYPNDPWEAGQLDRIRAFVEGGGSLLVFGEHTVREEDSGPDVDETRSRFNDVLEPTAMRVRFDSTMFTVGGWLHSYEALAHPTAAGIGDERNQFGVVIGASVEARWPARPLLVGRWGYADPGDVGRGASMMGNRRYDPGEKLGDLVLAAEQRVGKGRVVAFGDTSSITNGITIGAHVYTSRLLAYLAGGARSAQSPARGVMGLLLAAGLAALLLLWPSAPRAGLAVALLAASLAVCTSASRSTIQVLPDGRRIRAEASSVAGEEAAPDERIKALAYLDGAHVSAASDESWRPDGTMGLAMTLMRNGYLVLDLPELTRERLDGAALLVSSAPLRAYSKLERRVVRDWVRAGGHFICTVGWDERGPSRELLADLGFRVGPADGEARPLGHFKSPYVRSDDYMAHVRYHAAWPTEFVGLDDESTITPSQVRDWPRFCEVLRKLAAQEHAGPGRRIWSLLPAEAQQAVKRSEKLKKIPDDVKDVIVAGLNAIVTRPDLYQAKDFEQIKMPPEAKTLIAQKRDELSERDVLRLNRLVLEASFGWFLAPSRQVIAYGHGDTTVILLRRLGEGKAVVVGDTGFTMNKNLERIDGSPFEGMRENADFWRWLITVLRDEKMWIPPNPLKKPAEGQDE